MVKGRPNLEVIAKERTEVGETDTIREKRDITFCLTVEYLCWTDSRRLKSLVQRE